MVTEAGDADGTETTVEGAEGPDGIGTMVAGAEDVAGTVGSISAAALVVPGVETAMLVGGSAVGRRAGAGLLV